MDESNYNQSDIYRSDEVSTNEPEIKVKKQNYLSKVFFAMFWSWMGGFVVVFILQAVLMFVVPEIAENSWITMGISIFHTIITMLMFGLFLPPSDHSRHPVTAKMNSKVAVRLAVISCGIMFAGAFAGSGLSAFLGSLTGLETENVVDEMVYNTDFLPLIIGVAIMAPVFEELFFRKLLIDALNRYGTVFCCVVSGLLFGVFHGNFYQFFYAFGLGMLLAYIYCVYGKIRYTILLHTIINIFGSAIPLAVEYGAEKHEWISVIYAVVYLALAITGICMLVKDIKWFRCYTVESSVPKPFGKLVNGGFIALMVMGAGLFVLYML